MRTTQIRRNEKGVSLLEVLISMLILGFGLLALAPMIVMSVEGNIISRDHSDTSRLAREKIEYYEGLDLMPAVPFVDQEDGINGIFSRITSVRDSTCDSLIPFGVYQVDVQLTWLDNHNVNRNINYSTYILR
ncbi:MAG: prepilin-type N-terminal cleavage/methylation domain-containing protein [candidate division Zixibacteria bacterium]|nr:prepilin-type N-terminal cleavage/methylation domain-containing protein [candidate division Zixibacteria bacterium]